MAFLNFKKPKYQYLKNRTVLGHGTLWSLWHIYPLDRKWPKQKVSGTCFCQLWAVSARWTMPWLLKKQENAFLPQMSLTAKHQVTTLLKTHVLTYFERCLNFLYFMTRKFFIHKVVDLNLSIILLLSYFDLDIKNWI